jgi:FkbH-like protein
MNIKFFRNIFIENIINDLEFSNKTKGISFETSDYSHVFNKELFNNYDGVFFIIDFSKIKNNKSYLKEIKKYLNYLKKKKINYVFLYFSNKNLIKDRHSLNLKNCLSVNPKKTFLKKGILFDNRSYNKLTNLIEIFLAIFTKYKLRGIVFDLDNTLWEGIIGEDKKVKFNKFQKKNLILINELIKKGFLSSLVSKNNLLDVKNFMCSGILDKIFNKSKKYISWDEKSYSLKKFIEWSKLDQSNFLYFDDNENENLKISYNFPKMFVFNAKDHELISFILSQLNIFTKKNKVASLRHADLENNEFREELKKNSIIKFIKSTSPEVTIFKNPKKQILRIEEMSKKINQFNLSDERYSKRQIRFFLKSKVYDIFTFSLKDKFGDSGVVGYAIINKMNEQLEIKDIKISCRALGRDLEVFFINKILLKNNFNQKNIRINYKKTVRNKPVYYILKKNFNHLYKIKKGNIKDLKYFSYVKVRFY